MYKVQDKKKRIIGQKREQPKSLVEHTNNNKLMALITIFILSTYVWIFNTNFFEINDSFKPYLLTNWNLDKIGLFIITLFLSLLLSMTYKEKTIKDWNLTINKLLWVFLIGLVSLTSIRNSYLHSLYFKDVVNKEIKDLKQI